MSVNTTVKNRPSSNSLVNSIMYTDIDFRMCLYYRGDKEKRFSSATLGLYICRIITAS